MLTVRINPLYLGQASELIQIVRAARQQDNRTNDVYRPGDDKTPTPWPLTILALSFAQDADLDFAFNADIAPMSDLVVSSRCQGILLVDGPTNRGPSSPCT
jgi:hypothetical protein